MVWDVPLMPLTTFDAFIVSGTGAVPLMSQKHDETQFIVYWYESVSPKGDYRTISTRYSDFALTKSWIPSSISFPRNVKSQLMCTTLMVVSLAYFPDLSITDRIRVKWCIYNGP